MTLLLPEPRPRVQVSLPFRHADATRSRRGSISEEGRVQRRSGIVGLCLLLAWGCTSLRSGGSSDAAVVGRDGSVANGGSGGNSGIGGSGGRGGSDAGGSGGSGSGTGGDGGATGGSGGTAGSGGTSGSTDAEVPDAEVVVHPSCVGNESMTICDVADLHECSDAGASVRSETCASAAHCQAGLAGGSCAPCIDGEFRCQGAALDHCVDNAFVLMTTCDTEALCNEVTGTCTSAACLADQYVCQSDELKRCNATQTALEDVATCPSGLCDQAGEQCDVCAPGSKTCAGNQVSTCSGDGQAVTLEACPSGMSRCTGQGNCVECTTSSHCSPNFCVSNECVDCRNAGDCSAGTCRAATCNGGACGSTITAGAACGSGNVCTTGGACVQCRNDQDCVTRGGGTPFCTASNTCVACRAPADCPVAPCRAATCNSGVCGQTTLTSGTCGSGRVCNLSGVCETACGNRRFDVGIEECDATSSSFTQFNCSPSCTARTIWTTCKNGEGCIAPSHCVVSFGMDKAFCSPDCPAGEAAPPECNQLLPPAAQFEGGLCFGGDCMIQCMADYECPAPMRCDEGGACVSR